MDKPEFSVSVHNLNLAIITLEGSVTNIEESEINLNLSINGQSYTSKPKTTIVNNRANFSLYILSYLLESGEHTLTISLANYPTVSNEISIKTEKRGRLAKQVGEALKEHKVPLVIDRPIDSTDFPYSDEKLFPWFDHTDALEKVSTTTKLHGLNNQEEEALRSFVEDGYAHLDKYLDDSLIDKVNEEIDNLIKADPSLYNDGSGERIQHLHLKSKLIADLWTHPSIMRFLDAVFEDEAVPCQTLTFLHGSEQSVHQDVIHLTPFPAGYMCGVWIALEDISEDAGPLTVLPKSHRALPRIYTNTINVGKVENGDYNKIGKGCADLIDKYITQKNLKHEIYTPKKGSVLIWHENLLHAGIKRNNPSLSRRSLVGHYFCRGAISFYDATGTPAILDENQRWKFNQ